MPREPAPSLAPEMPPRWPAASRFTPETILKFRLPFFANLRTYPNNEPLYNVLYVPRGYDPARRYPLVVRFQPQGGEPQIWPFEHVAKRWGGVIVLGVSWPLVRRYGNAGIRTPGAKQHWYAATARWVFSNFSIDRSRVFVGGFSAGGWSASTQGMAEPMRNISTHFVITGAGMKDASSPELFRGRPVFVAAGTRDGNYRRAVAAERELLDAGFEVRYFEEDGVGHWIGREMDQVLCEWFDGFEPGANSRTWLAEAARLEEDQPAEACALYARVAALGPSDECGARARRRLVDLEGDALVEYEDAYELLRARRYAEAAGAFVAAGRTAGRCAAPRLVDLCRVRRAEVDEWQFGEQATTMVEALYTGRPYESFLLARDGETRHAASAVTQDWAELFASQADDLDERAAKAKRLDPERARVQSALLAARVAIWRGAYDEAREPLERIVASAEGTPEAVDAEMLLERIAGVAPA